MTIMHSHVCIKVVFLSLYPELTDFLDCVPTHESATIMAVYAEGTTHLNARALQHRADNVPTSTQAQEKKHQHL